MIKLPNVTMICIDCYNYKESIIAMNKCLQQIEPARSVFITDRAGSMQSIETVKIGKITSKEEYSYFCIKELYKYFDTSHCLLIQHDGYVLDGNQWKEEFLQYDYIGAPWLYIDGRNVGNGGFSLRSHKFCEAIANDPIINVYHPEDDVICRLYRRHLESKGFSFAPDELAHDFSYELNAPKKPTFGFHGHFHKPFQPVITVKRTGAMGDVIMVEPVLHYFHLKGFRVVLDTMDQFYSLFEYHPYPVFHKTDPIAKFSERTFDLDMSYERMPKENHLQAYYKACGITDGQIRNPVLKTGIEVTNANKLTRKYVIIHVDDRAQPYRNIYGVDWAKIAKFFISNGYDVVQLGHDKHKIIPGVFELRTPFIQYLMYVVRGADMFIGIDSGISHIASALNIPSVIFFGSVDPQIIHPVIGPDKKIIHNHKGDGVCHTPFCWHDIIGCEGKQCVVDIKHPPCTQYETDYVLSKIKELYDHTLNTK